MNRMYGMSLRSALKELQDNHSVYEKFVVCIYSALNCVVDSLHETYVRCSGEYIYMRQRSFQ